MAEVTLKQIYGMLCWIRAYPDNYRLWHKSQKQACQRAIEECPHLKDASVEALAAKFDELEELRRRLIEEHDGMAINVPRDTRLFEGGPLFAIVDHTLSEEPQSPVGVLSHGAAHRLTPAEANQLRDEMIIRRRIAIRDATLLADWIAMRRRELELQEAKIRELIRKQQEHEYCDSAEDLARFEEIIRQFHAE
ncbi:hypothetical protein IWW48_004442 [Coemansia sp. RSA 1200]|nr:hypothetical protein IWW48_004442 [Coemansia sp. RSA 1200]